ncbi:MAG: TonB-dependent receptor [Gammaproteobacteria bacterium]
MRNTFPGKRNALTLAVMIAGTSLTLSAVAQQDEVEEVVVTGSYLRGTPEDAPSPVDVIDRASIEAQGASQIWDVIRNLEVNQGSDTSVAGTNDAGQLSGTASVNLRNLGGNSTLTLINGKRFTPAAVVSSSGQEFVDLNSIPLVMTDRVEVLTDGGSALYGSDAVAGVVNIIMRTDFEGLELYADTQGIQEAGSTYEETISGIWGTSFNDGDTRLVLSGEYFNRDPVALEDSQYFDEDRTINTGRVGSFSVSGVLGNPFTAAGSRYIDNDLTAQNKAERAALGEAFSGLRGVVYVDPLCDELAGNQGDFFVDNRYSGIGRRSGTCVEDNMDNQFIAIGQERTSAAASFEHTFSDSLEFYSFFQYSDTETIREWDGTASSRSTHLFLDPTTLGALSSFFGNGVAPLPTNAPILAANGGPGFGWYGSGVLTGWPRTDDDLTTENTSSGVQTGLRGEFTALDDRRFNYDVSLSWSDSSIEQNVATLQRDRTELAINGLGGPNCTPNGTTDANFLGVSSFAPLAGLFDVVFPGYILNTRESYSLALTSTNHGQGGCEFFNPFLTALTDPNLANSQELLDWMSTRIKRADKRNQLMVFDAIVSGELFEMTGGTAQFAAGVQRRERDASGRAPAINQPGLTVITGYGDAPFPGGDLFATPNQFEEGITNNLECASCIFNFDDSRSINAAFVEFSLPFAANVESQVALRWEDYGGNIGSDISPKVALSWRPIEELLLRGSFSQSFRAPNIGVVNQAFEAFSTTVLDPLRNQDVRAGLLPATNDNGIANSSFTSGAPNPDLGNENANTYNIGFQWTPDGAFDGLRLGADIWRFEVEDRVLPLIPRAALNPEIAAFNAAVQDPNNFILNDSIPLDGRGPDGQPIACNPNDPSTYDDRRNCVVNPAAYVVPGIQRTVNDENAGLTTIVLPAVNAGNIEVQGIDVSAGYSWDNDWGRFRVGIEYTHVDEYLVKDVPGLELGLQETGKFDAAGVDGEQNIVREVPDNRGTISFSWSRDDHRLSVFNRHIGSYQVLSHDDYLANPTRNPLDAAFAKPKVASYDTWDLQYSYTMRWSNLALGETQFSLGVIDLTDEDIPLFRRNTYDASVFDARGRRWYARARWSF